MGWAKRILTVVVCAPIALSCIQNQYSTLVLVVCLLFVSLMEFKMNLSQAIVYGDAEPRSVGDIRLSDIYMVAMGLFQCYCAFWGSFVHDVSSTFCFIGLFVVHLVKFYGGLNVADVRSVLSLILDIFGLRYISWAFGHMILLRGVEKYGTGLTLLLMCCVWNTDNGALIIGSLLRGKLFLPAVSPGKTWAGVLGGLFGSTVTALILQQVFASGLVSGATLPPFLGPWESLVVGLALGVCAIVGDLVVSLLKRAAGVKDSGALFPGHGGALDRMDSMLPAAPFLYFVVASCSSGAPADVSSH